MLPYTIDGVVLTTPESEYHRFLIGAALTGLASPSVSIATTRAEALSAFAQVSADAIDLADAVVREMRSRIDEANEGTPEAPPPAPTGHYWIGIPAEIDAWIKTRRSRRPVIARLVERIWRKQSETRGPVSLVVMVEEWDASLGDLRALIGARVLVEASDMECASTLIITPDAKSDALTVRARVMASEGLPSDFQEGEDGQ